MCVRSACSGIQKIISESSVLIKLLLTEQSLICSCHITQCITIVDLPEKKIISNIQSKIYFAILIEYLLNLIEISSECIDLLMSLKSPKVSKTSFKSSVSSCFDTAAGKTILLIFLCTKNLINELYRPIACAPSAFCALNTILLLPFCLLYCVHVRLIRPNCLSCIS